MMTKCRKLSLRALLLPALLLALLAGLLAVPALAADGTFADVQTLIDQAASGSIIALDPITYKGSGTAIKINRDIIIDLNGATLDANGESGIFTVESGILTLTDSSATDPGRLVNGNPGVTVLDASFTLTGNAVISNCSDNDGGGVVVDESSSFTMSGGSITSCHANRGGGVYNEGTFTLSGGSISGCEGREGGGGVFNTGSGSFTMSGGSITNCIAYSGGVYNDATFTMTGGSITGCSCDFYGGVAITGGSFTLSGSPVISGNSCNGKASNVWLAGDKYISIGSGGLASGASIGVTTKTAPAAGSPVTIVESYSGSTGFFSSDGGYTVECKNGALHLSADPVCSITREETTTQYLSLAKAVEAAQSGDVIVMLADSSLSAPIEISKKLTIDLKGADVDGGKETYFFDVVSGGDLTLTDTSATDPGRLVNGYSAITGTVRVQSAASFTLTGNAGIYGCSASIGGGVYNEGTFTLSGNASISGCSSSGDGGGVTNIGTFTMAGGSISGCSSSGDGGGVFNEETFTMTGGSITGCSSSGDGGGVCAAGGSFTLSDSPVISGNSCNGKASNVWLADGEYISIGSGGLASGASIGVTTATAPAAGSPIPVTGGADQANAAGFFSSDAGHDAFLREDGQVWLGLHGFTVSTDGAAVKAACDSCGESYTAALSAPLHTTYGDGRDPEAGISFLHNGSASSATEWAAAGLPALSVSYSGCAEAPVNAGSCTAILTAGTGEDAMSASLDYGIAQKPLAVVWGATSFEYDGGKHVPQASLDGVLQGDACTVVVAGEGTDAGNYTASAKGLAGNASGNYCLSDESVKTAFTISPRSLAGDGFSIDPIRAQTFTGSAITPVPTVRWNGNALTADTDYTVSYENNREAGAAGITVSGKGNFKDELKTVFSIEPKEVSLTWGAAEFTYDGAKHAPSCSAGPFAEGDSVSVIVEGAASQAGRHTATALLTGESAGNYRLPDANTKEFTIGRRALTVRADDKTKTYGDADPKLTASVTGAADGDGIEVVLKREPGENAGSYAIIPELRGAAAANYEAELQAGSLTIGRRTVTVFGIAAKDKVYDGTTGAELDFSRAVISGRVGDDELGVTALGVFSDRNAGSGKTVTITGAALTGSAKDNYVLAWNGVHPFASASISPAPLTPWIVRAADRVYDGTTDAEVTVSAFLGALPFDNVRIEAEGSFSDRNAGVNKAVGVRFSLAGRDAGNYRLTMEGMTVRASISPATLKISGIRVLDKVYDGTTDAQLSPMGLDLEGEVFDEISAEPSAVFESADAGKGVKAAVSLRFSATDRASGGDASANYVLVYAKEAFADILPKEVSLTWGATEFDFDGAEHAPSCSAGSLIGDDTVEVTVTGAASGAGVHTASAAGLTGEKAGNYTLPADCSVSFTIREPEQRRLIGDVNGDGLVDTDDAMLVLRYDVGRIGADGLDLSVGDVNGDGFVDTDDAMLILRYDVGRIERFPVEE